MKRTMPVMLGVALLIAVGAGWLLSGETSTTEAKNVKGSEVRFEFSTTYSGPQTATEIVALTLCAANIGSSGLDGVRAPECPDNPDGTPFRSDWQVDSFFDVEYRTEAGDSTSGETRTVDIELVALSLTSADPVEVLDDVDAELSRAVKKHKHRGHVTILK